MNKVILSGHVGQDPKKITFDNGGALLNFSLATNFRWKDGEEWKDGTDWHSVVIAGSRVDFAENNIAKGTKLLIEGKLKHRKVEKDGKTNYYTEVFADNFEILTWKDKEPTDDLPY